MKTRLTALIFLALLTPLTAAEDPDAKTIDIRGDKSALESNKISSVWLYPEDYEGKTIRLYGFLFEPENFEYFPDLNGYLFSFEPVLYARNNSYHVHVGNSTFMSREKLNFFCSTADGQRIRRLFKEHQGDVAMPAEVVIEVKQRDYVYLGILKSYKPRNVTE